MRKTAAGVMVLKSSSFVGDDVCCDWGEVDGSGDAGLSSRPGSHTPARPISVSLLEVGEPVMAEGLLCSSPGTESAFGSTIALEMASSSPSASKIGLAGCTVSLLEPVVFAFRGATGPRVVFRECRFRSPVNVHVRSRRRGKPPVSMKLTVSSLC